MNTFIHFFWWISAEEIFAIKDVDVMSDYADVSLRLEYLISMVIDWEADVGWRLEYVISMATYWDADVSTVDVWNMLFPW